jgi:alkylation response protein AidB-like acyl-CoA dehydrogenase
VDFAYTREDEAFRDELTQWLAEHLPPFLEKWSANDEGDGPAGATGIMRSMERRRAWQRELNQGRWAAIHWPPEWGGRNATITQNVIYSEVMAAHRTPGIYNANGLWQIGPMIIQWGTEEQKRLWIPNILNADGHWCQGFTEPEAGSDLANLRTTALRDGDDYVVNGHKIWISSAHIAKWGLFLVRTDPTALERGAKHEGITALIIDLDVDGIGIRPIRDIAGEEMFCELFFDGARVPAAYRLGDEGDGWRVAMGTLGKERVGTSGLAIGMRSDLDAMIRTRSSASASPAPTSTSSTPSSSTTGRSRRSSRTRRTGRRCRWPSSSGATSRRRWPSWPSTCWGRPE